MSYMIKVRRCTLIFAVLIVFFLLSPMVVAAKHIIVIYDVSGSMISLRVGGRTNTYMESEDIRRVNDYVMGLLFTDTSQSLRDQGDSYIKACDTAYVGKPLYQTGDILTYAEYADRRYVKASREEVHQDEFQRNLPDPTRLMDAFHGQVSYLLRAEVEVYDALYSDEDDETYWIFVTDGDIDNSGKSDPEISSVLKRHAEIEDEYYAQMILGIFVNNHVKIEVRRIQETDKIRTIFIANRTVPDKPIEKIQLSRDDKGQFISETLTIDTKNSEKAKFRLNSVNVEVVDKYNKPVRIVNEDNTSGLLEVMPVLLNSNPPPYKFRIPFLATPEIAAPGNVLKLEVTYSYDGIDQQPYSVPPLAYTAVIDSIYVSEADNPDGQATQLTLQFSEDMYRTRMIIQSESPNKEAFKINQIQCYIQYKDGRKLCDATVSSNPKGLDEPFNIMIPKEDRLDWYGNKLLLDIDYEYEGTTKSATFGISFKLRGGSDFPVWLLIVPLVVLCGAGVYVLIKRVRPSPIAHQLALTEVSKDGTFKRETQLFTLENETKLEFGPRGPEEFRFDVGSPAFLYYVDEREILFFEDADADDGQLVEPPERLTLSRGEADEVHISVEFVEEQPDESPVDADSGNRRDPLDV